jgi:hypothetical protein
MHPSRRFLIAATPALALARPARASIPPAGALRFAIWRKGSDIGTHTVTFDRAGNDLRVTIAVRIAVGLGPIKLYHYTLDATETWRAGTLMACNSDTNDGGKIKYLRAARQNGKLMVEGSKGGKYTAPDASITSSHWNPAEVEAPMVDLGDGELLDFKVAPKVKTTIEARGKTIQATHISLSGPARLDLYYDDAGVWSALKAITNEDGSLIEYKQV